MTGFIRPRDYRELGIMCGFPPPPEKCPTLNNWDLPPFNRWSFQNMRSLFPTVDVRRGTGVVPVSGKNDPAVLDLRFATPEGKDKSVRQSLLQTYTDGFLIRIGGDTLLEFYGNAMTPYTPHLAQSVSKSLIGTLAGILVGEGLLALDAPLVRYVPELAGCGYGTARLADLLDMRSGVRFSEDYGHPASDMTRLDVASGWRPATGERCTIRDLILTLPQERPHGGAFSYRSIETDVLAWVIERAADRSLADLLSERIWRRIGAENDAFFTVDSAGTVLADGGFCATLRDFARFGEMMLNNGRVGDDQVVPPDWITAIRHGDPHAFGAPYTDLSPDGCYSRQWWVHDARRGDYMARGVFGQLIYIDPARGLLAVKLSSWPDYLMPGFVPETLALINALAAAGA
ncbi:serine hydrolase [Martelella sp. HB161492]|uniref:serine hydrolase domain-containing protein n=1 Tax=Martelella sp. HB161492 TaxID=2720726 RepID=UPI001591B77F|nr:serine hydrolase [Martelella sp. HB161492]